MGCVSCVCCKNKAKGPGQRFDSMSRYSRNRMMNRFIRVDSIAKFSSRFGPSVFSADHYDPLAHCPELTHEQKQTLRDSWQVLAMVPDPLKNVINAFVRMFLLSPDSAQTFSCLKDTGRRSTKHELLKKAVTRKHFFCVIDFLGDTIGSLDHVGELRPQREKIGGRHVQRGVRVEFLQPLCEGYLFAFEKTLWPEVDAQVVAAWEALFQIIAHDWTRGFQRAMEEDPKSHHSWEHSPLPSSPASASSAARKKDKEDSDKSLPPQ